MKIGYLLFSFFSALGAGFYLVGAIIRKNFWFTAVASLILSTIVIASLISIGIYIATRKAKKFTKRIIASVFAFCSALIFASIYYGVFINPVYRYAALAIPTVIIFGLLLLAVAWAESVMFRGLYIHDEEIKRRLTKSRLLSGVISLLSLSLAVVLIIGIIGHKDWVISLPASIFVVVILLSYFFYGLVVIVGKKPSE